MRGLLPSKLRMPEVLRIVGEESRRNGTDKLTSRRLDQIIKRARAEKRTLEPKGHASA
jgi:hypothetical protein